MNADMISLLLTSLLGLIITAFGIYFKSYFDKKGKNLADKDDLEKLTDIVESVKSGYQKDVEFLKSGLSLITQKQGAIFNEEKTAIVEFFGQWNAWVWDTFHIEVHEYFHGNFDDLTSKITRLREAYRKTQIAHSKIQLLIRKPDVGEASHKIVSLALEMHGEIDIIASSLKRNLTSEKTLVDTFFKDLGKQQNPLKNADEKLVNQFLADQAKELAEERRQLLQQYRDLFKAKFGPLMRERDVFMDKAREYLNTHQ